MRVAFAGTPPFAAAALEAILAAGHDVPLVLTQPDRPAGRGMRLTASAVAAMAQSRGLRTAKPESLKGPEAASLLSACGAQVLVVAAYGLILPASLLALPPKGCINIHASLLPRWRGAAPIQRAILAGDAVSGVSIMQMDAGLDTGPVLLAREHPIGPRDTSGRLTEALARLGASAVVEALRDLDRLVPRAQDNAGATYAAKIAKSEARVDWSRDAVEIDRQVRALDPAPGAEARLGSDVLKIWAATPLEGSAAPGAVVRGFPGELRIGCGRGILRLDVVQRPGGRRLPAAEFLKGNPLEAGVALT